MWGVRRVGVEMSWWVGVIADDTYSNGGPVYDFKKVPTDLSVVLRELLTPYGLWSEENYGLHSIIYCSC